MKPLPEQYELNKWHYKVLKRDGDVVLVSQSKVENLPASGTAAAYEVFVVQKQKAREFMASGKPIVLEAKEMPPSTELWGTLGWTYPTREAADAGFAKTVARQAARKAKEASGV